MSIFETVLPRIEELFDKRKFVSCEDSIMVVYKLPEKEEHRVAIKPKTPKVWNTKLMLGNYSLTMIQRFSSGTRQEFVGIMKPPDASDDSGKSLYRMTLDFRMINRVTLLKTSQLPSIQYFKNSFYQ